MIVVIDNKDSFTYNLINYFKIATKEPIKVIDIDYLILEELVAFNPNAIVISPGPGRPSDYPKLFKVIETFYQQVPILGVCLGFQVVYEYFGGKIVHRNNPIHGHTTKLSHQQLGIFKGIPHSFNVMLYHSLMADKETLPNELKVTAIGEDGVIMGLQHQQYSIFAVQYHPESILSEHGYNQIQNFLEIVGENIEYRI